MRVKKTQAEIAKEEGCSQQSISRSLAKFRAEGKAMDKNNQSPDYRLSAALLKSEQAREAKRENDLEEGKLHRSDDCDRARTEEAAIIRAELLNLGNKLAPELSDDPDGARRAKDILDRWAHETLTSWAAWANGKRVKK
jgi:CRP-like cAMP-binding protein